MADARGAPSQRRSKERPAARTAEAETLNFKVASEFKKEFKGFDWSEIGLGSIVYSCIPPCSPDLNSAIQV